MTGESSPSQNLPSSDDSALAPVYTSGSNKTSHEKAVKKSISTSMKLLFGGLIVVLVLLGIGAYFGLQYYQVLPGRSQDLARKDYGSQVIVPLNDRQKSTYESNKPAIDSFVGKLDKSLQEWMQNVVIIALDDVNAYLFEKGRQGLSLSNLELVDDVKMESLIASQDPNVVLLDVREDYEREFQILKGTRPLRFGNILNNEFAGLNKDQEIIVICSTASRSFIAANYLASQGFTNVKSYNGGVLTWLQNGFPVEKNISFKFINSVVPYIMEEDAKKQQNEGSEELLFASTAEIPAANNSLFMDDRSLEKMISSLSLDKKYIIRCTDHVHCFSAVVFWDKAKDKGIKFAGYTGYRYPSQNP